MNSRLAELIDVLCDRPLSPDRVAELDALLLADPQSTRDYIRAIHLHATLTRHVRNQTLRLKAASASAWRAADDSPTPTLSGASPRSVWYLAALIMLAAALTYVFLPSTPHSQLPTPHSAAPATYAILSDLSPDAAFADGDLPLGEGLTAPIKLTAGRAQLMFKSSAVVDLTGPCEFQMTGPNRGRLTSGKLEAYCRPEAHGFTVDLPDGSSLIDLGTKFSVDLNVQQVRIAEGSVRLIDPARFINAVLHQGQTAVMDATAGGWTSSRPVELADGGFESEADHDAWIMDGVLLRQSAARLRPHAGERMIAFYSGGPTRPQLVRILRTSPGKTYELNFHLARQTGSGQPILQVDVFDAASTPDRAAVGDLAHERFFADAPMNQWTEARTVRFVARSSDTCLRFIEAADSPTRDVDVFLDDVSLNIFESLADSAGVLSEPTPDPSSVKGAEK
ncbi:MAG: hypothetical protein GC162_19245 [Planctomycetes bacterium]|nr:hypothetical protein [Planctomycetota bacterium]